MNVFCMYLCSTFCTKQILAHLPNVQVSIFGHGLHNKINVDDSGMHSWKQKQCDKPACKAASACLYLSSSVLCCCRGGGAVDAVVRDGGAVDAVVQV
jgi:hypothetical protein